MDVLMLVVLVQSPTCYLFCRFLTVSPSRSASNWRLLIMARQLPRWEAYASLFCASGSSRTTKNVQSRCATEVSTKQTHKKDRCWSGRALESPLSESALPCQLPAGQRQRQGQRQRRIIDQVVQTSKNEDEKKSSEWPKLMFRLSCARQ